MLKTNHMDFYQPFQKLQKYPPKGVIFFFWELIKVLRKEVPL